MCVWAAPFSGLAAAPPLPRSWLEDFHAVCYLAVDRWTTSRTVPGTERTHHQPGQSPVKHNQDSVFNKNQTNKQKSQKKKKEKEKNSLQNLFFKEKAADSSSSEGLVGNCIKTTYIS